MKGAESVVKQFGFLRGGGAPENSPRTGPPKNHALMIDRYLKHLHLVKRQNLVDLKLPVDFLT